MDEKEDEATRNAGVVRRFEDGENEKENKDADEEELPTKESAILRGGVTRRALDLLLVKIGIKGFYPLGIFFLLFYANAIAKMYIPLTTFVAWLPHHCCQVNGTLVEVINTDSAGSPPYHANWSYNDRKHHPDPPPKHPPRMHLSREHSPPKHQAVPVGESLPPVSQYRRHRQQHRRHRMNSAPKSLRMKDDQEVCVNLVHEYGWRYATKPSYSMAADLDLGCRNASHLVQISNALFMTGFGLGGLTHGLVADLRGRKSVLVYSSLLLPVMGAITAADEDENFYMGMRFLQGFFEGGVLLSSSTMICELFPSSMRALPHLTCQMSNVIGFFMLDLTAYLERRWRVLILILPLFFLGTIIFSCVIPESLEWLFMTGQVKRACEQLQKILNKKGIKSDVYNELFSTMAQSERELQIVDHRDSFPGNMSMNRFSEEEEEEEEERDLDKNNAASFETEEMALEATRQESQEGLERELLLRMASSSGPPAAPRNRWNLTTNVVVSALASITLINYFIYYGLVLATDEFSGDRYLNFFLFALADLGGVVIAMALISVAERRRIAFGTYVVIAVVAAVILVFDFLVVESDRPQFYDYFLLGSHLLIKINVLTAVSVMELSAVEMPPTAVRSIASGIFFAFKGLAGVTASFVSWLMRHDAYAETVFLVLVLAAIALLFALPEMKDATIPRNEEDLKYNLRQTKYKYRCIENWSQNKR